MMAQASVRGQASTHLIRVLALLHAIRPSHAHSIASSTRAVAPAAHSSAAVAMTQQVQTAAMGEGQRAADHMGPI